MELGNSFKMIKFCGCNTQNIANTNSYYGMTIPKTNYLDNVNNDCFIKKTSSVPDEIEELFPNGEFEKIYNDIVKKYGITNPPKIVWGSLDNNADGRCDPEVNTIFFDHKNLLEKKYKVLIEYTDSDGQIKSGYQPSSLNLVAAYKDEEAFYKDAKADCDRFEIKYRLVPLTNDDKRKQIIFRFAHELEHAFQYQAVNQTEGLSLYDLLKEIRIKNDKNLISKNIFLLTWDKKFNEIYGNNTTKIYKKDSKEGQFASKIYDAAINYPYYKKGSIEYYNNFLERDANARGYAYLIKNYGNFDNIIDIRELQNYIQSKSIRQN